MRSLFLNIRNNHERCYKLSPVYDSIERRGEYHPTRPLLFFFFYGEGGGGGEKLGQATFREQFVLSRQILSDTWFNVGTYSAVLIFFFFFFHCSCTRLNQNCAVF